MSESTVFRALDSAMHKVRAKAQAQLVEKMRELRDPGAAERLSGAASRPPPLILHQRKQRLHRPDLCELPIHVRDL
jgi:hypothetical protein